MSGKDVVTFVVSWFISTLNEFTSKKYRSMLTLVFGIYVSEAMVNRSLDLGLIAKDAVS